MQICEGGGSPEAQLEVRTGAAAQHDSCLADGHRVAHVDEQAGARLQVPEVRRGVPVGVPGGGGTGVDRQGRELIALPIAVRVERSRAGWLERPGTSGMARGNRSGDRTRTAGRARGMPEPPAPYRAPRKEQYDDRDAQCLDYGRRDRWPLRPLDRPPG